VHIFSFKKKNVHIFIYIYIGYILVRDSFCCIKTSINLYNCAAKWKPGGVSMELKVRIVSMGGRVTWAACIAVEGVKVSRE
jgi:hypothetical protein